MSYGDPQEAAEVVQLVIGARAGEPDAIRALENLSQLAVAEHPDALELMGAYPSLANEAIAHATRAGVEEQGLPWNRDAFDAAVKGLDGDYEAAMDAYVETAITHVDQQHQAIEAEIEADETAAERARPIDQRPTLDDEFDKFFSAENAELRKEWGPELDREIPTSLQKEYDKADAQQRDLVAAATGKRPSLGEALDNFIDRSHATDTTTDPATGGQEA